MNPELDLMGPHACDVNGDWRTGEHHQEQLTTEQSEHQAPDPLAQDGLCHRLMIDRDHYLAISRPIDHSLILPLVFSSLSIPSAIAVGKTMK